MAVINIYPTPEKFLTKTNHNYPPGNFKVFEDFFLEKFLSEESQLERIYLPIQWTCFYISRNYGNSNMDDLQIFLNSLPKDKKYFTIVQWDDGILNDVRHLDIKIFSSGGVGDYPIPLINSPHTKIERNRDIFGSFIGMINGRHRIREKMYEILKDKKEYFISSSVGFNKFKETMERSIFSLCPRGYGKTSFRINESLNLGSIPVYIYDDPWIPFNDKINFSDYGILIPESDLNDIDQILKSISTEKIKSLQENGLKIYNEYYIYSSCYEQIVNILKK